MREVGLCLMFRATVADYLGNDLTETEKRTVNIAYRNGKTVKETVELLKKERSEKLLKERLTHLPINFLPSV